MGMEQTRREIWAKRVERWRESGLSAKEFAAETGVNHHSLGKWRWKLAEGRETEPRSSGREKTSSSKPVEFIELVGAKQKSELKDRFEVVFAGGATLRVPPKFDPEVLKQLVVVLTMGR